RCRAPPPRERVCMSGAGTETVQAQDLTAPLVIPPLVAALRCRLLEAGLTEDGIRSSLGGAVDPWSLAAGQPASDNSALITLFRFGASLDAGQAQAALEPLRIADLETVGVVDVRDGVVRPRCIIRPVEGLLVASDLPGLADPVLGNVPASETLARLTVRRHSRRALDLGSGCGVQGLLL